MTLTTQHHVAASEAVARSEHPGAAYNPMYFQTLAVDAAPSSHDLRFQTCVSATAHHQIHQGHLCRVGTITGASLGKTIALRTDKRLNIIVQNVAAWKAWTKKGKHCREVRRLIQLHGRRGSPSGLKSGGWQRFGLILLVPLQTQMRCFVSAGT